MTVVVEQDVLRFEVTVDDIKGMQVIEGESHLCRVKLGHWIREPLTTTSTNERENKGGRTFDLLKRVNSSPPGT